MSASSSPLRAPRSTSSCSLSPTTRGSICTSCAGDLGAHLRASWPRHRTVVSGTPRRREAAEPRAEQTAPRGPRLGAESSAVPRRPRPSPAPSLPGICSRRAPRQALRSPAARAQTRPKPCAVRGRVAGVGPRGPGQEGTVGQVEASLLRPPGSRSGICRSPAAPARSRRQGSHGPGGRPQRLPLGLVHSVTGAGPRAKACLGAHDPVVRAEPGLAQRLSEAQRTGVRALPLPAPPPAACGELGRPRSLLLKPAEENPQFI